MKRILALVVSLALLLGGAAVSESTDPSQGDDLKRIVEEWSPYGLTVVTEADGTLYFTTRADALGAYGVLRSASQGFERALAEIYGSAVYVAKDNTIYYLSAENSRLLFRLDPITGVSQQALDLGFENAALADSLNGLLVSGLVSSGVYASQLYDPATGALVPSDMTPPLSTTALEPLRPWKPKQAA